MTTTTASRPIAANASATFAATAPGKRAATPAGAYLRVLQQLIATLAGCNAERPDVASIAILGYN